MLLSRARLADPRSRVVLIFFVAALVSATAAAALVLRPSPAVVAIASSPSPSPTEPPTPRPTPAPTLEPTPSPTASPSPTPEPPVGIGSDGRLTVLLLGSDFRRGHAGSRTDTMMVVSFDPVSGATAAASIPRDTVNFPLPGGSVYRPKINGLYQSYVASSGVEAAGAKMKSVVAKALHVEIDYYALITFGGVTRLIDAIGGVDVTLNKAVVDPVYWLSPTKHGVTFPAGVNHLNGQRALIFARTRKGDNDFERARRQQQLIIATVDKVRSKGLAILPALLRVGRNGDYIRTDLPLTLAPQVYRLIGAADAAHATQVVFGPRTWASSTGGTAFALKIDKVREWIARWMAPVAAPPVAAPPADGTAASPRP